MDETTTPRGMATANYWADDVAAARDWYAEVLGIAPYFAMPPDTDSPSYVEFRVGRDGDELGIVDRRFGAPAGAPGGVVLYWAVDDAAATHERLIALGATPFQPVTAQGDNGFITAAVLDPFGNVFGFMQNPHFAEVRAG
jgi:predicted enzyme related to lactoylglutathione lyase